MGGLTKGGMKALSVCLCVFASVCVCAPVYMFGWSEGGDGDRGGASCLSSPTWENNRTQHNSMDLPPDKRILHSAYCFVPPGNCNHLPKHDLTWTGRRDCAYAGVSQWGSINYARVRECVCVSLSDSH